MNRCICGVMVLAVLGASAGGARADTEAPATSPPSEAAAKESNFHARGGFGITPVAFQSDDELPTAHHGVGAFFTAFAELPYRLSLGAGFDWERYRYEMTTREAAPEVAFPDERLTYTRLLGLVEWDLLERGLVNPYLLAVVGLGWQAATKTSSHCSSDTGAGPVLGGGLGVDVAVSRWFAVGVEYRITAGPFTSAIACQPIDDPSDPRGDPSDFIPQRIALTLSVNDAF